MKDDLQKFHEWNLAKDPQYRVARQLLELGEAVAQLRVEVGLTRGELGKQLRVKARDIAIVEEETPRAPAGLLESALSVLLRIYLTKMHTAPEKAASLRTIRQLRPALVPA